MLSETEAYENFPIYLNQRLAYSRKNSNQKLSSFTSILVHCLAITKDSVYLRELLDKDVDKIIADCEIFFDMSLDKALDALKELSELAAVYFISENKSRYYKICGMIRKINASYPKN